MSFINTIDQLGDDVVLSSILDRSIVEFKDEMITNVCENKFNSCKSLIEVDLPNVTNIEREAFYSCESLEIVNFPNVISIGTKAFYLSRLTTIDLPNLTNLGEQVFQTCRQLKTVDLHNVTKIRNQEFYYCASLTTVILRSSAMCSLSNANALDRTPIKKGTGYIYVPNALIDSYKIATNWTTYANQFRALEDYTVDGTTTGELDPTKI